jgi:hypothetical protein
LGVEKKVEDVAMYPCGREWDHLIYTLGMGIDGPENMFMIKICKTFKHVQHRTKMKEIKIPILLNLY